MADRFGNLLTNLAGHKVDQNQSATLMERPLRWIKTYDEATPGEWVALVASDGFVQVAVGGGSAHAALKQERGLALSCVRVDAHA